MKDVLDLLAAGATHDEILADYPYLEPDDITAVLAFAAQLRVFGVGASMTSPCISCATVTGAIQPPGGIVFDDGCWVVFLRARPLSLGPLIQRTQAAFDSVLKPAKVHFGLYTESVRHIHLHVLPRMPTMPAGNIPMTFLHVWMELLARVRLKRPFTDDAVRDVALRLHDVFDTMP